MQQPTRVPRQQHIVSLQKGRAQLRDGRRWVKHAPTPLRDRPVWAPVGPLRCPHSYTHAGCPYGVCCYFLHANDDM
jgi:hypothetical protein